MATTSVEKIIALGPEPMAAPPTATGLRQKDDGGFLCPLAAATGEDAADQPIRIGSAQSVDVRLFSAALWIVGDDFQ
jgi:hypothetical protein